MQSWSMQYFFTVTEWKVKAGFSVLLETSRWGIILLVVVFFPVN